MIQKITVSRVIYFALWLAFALALASSIQHLAYTFGTMERAKGWGWVSAVAVDASLAGLAYSIQQRKRLDRPTGWYWGGVAFFSIISAGANLYYALSVEINATMTLAAIGSVDWLELIKAVVLSATLPMMVIYLGEVVSNDDAQEANKKDQAEQETKQKEEKAQRREDQRLANEAKKLELDQKRLEIEQQKMLLEQQRIEAEQQAATLEQQPTGKEVYCEHCQQTFRNRQAYAAHGCNKKQQPAVQVATLEPSANGKQH